MSVLRTRRNPCPYCGRENNAVHEIHDGQKPPDEGDYSICWGCGEISIFERNLELRKATVPELVVALADPEISGALIHWAREHTS